MLALHSSLLLFLAISISSEVIAIDYAQCNYFGSQVSKKPSNFCSSQGIALDFIPERAPHFGELWEAAVKSMKKHLSLVVGNARLIKTIAGNDGLVRV